MEDKDFLNEVVLHKKGNVIYVDFVLYSMVKAIDKWYKDNYRDDRWGSHRKAHKFHTIRFYDRRRFSDHKTLGEERDRYLTEIDLHVQMRRDD